MPARSAADIILAVIAIILLIVTVVVAFLVLRNFGGGLKYHSTPQF